MIAATRAGLPIVGLASTNQAAAALRDAGIPSTTIARFNLDGAPLAPNAVVVLDEISQVSTADAELVLAAVTATPGARLWCLGDPHQAQPVRAGGLGAEIARLAAAGCSHAWGRTVDGVQGGTWTQIHLLGTAALERFTGYVGQSRSRRPTHTWNVAPIPTTDVGGVPADRRDAAQAVLDGLQRLPDTGFAIHETTWRDESEALVPPPEAPVALALRSRRSRPKRPELPEALAHRPDPAASRLRSGRARRATDPGLDIEI